MLLAIPRTSIAPMVLHLHGADRNAVRAVQQFVSESAWDDRPILQQLWRDVAADLGDAEGVLAVDGGDFPKQGKESVGVKRQSCGELGKTANCQAGVVLAYASVHGSTLLDRRLYLPQDWFGEVSAERRAACGVPDDVTFTATPMLALAMIQDVVAAGVLPCPWVAGDEAFGDCPALLDGIAALGTWYVAEVTHTTRGWRARPATAVPAWSGRGRPPTQVQAAPDAAPALTVADLVAELAPTAWRRHTIQEGRQGPMAADVAFGRVVAVREGLPGPDVWLALRRSVTDGAVNAYRSNAPADIAVVRLVRVSGMRWPIETCVNVGKQALGMGDDDVRSWRGRHHHMTLTLLAMGFLVRLHGRCETTLPR